MSGIHRGSAFEQRSRLGWLGILEATRPAASGDELMDDLSVDVG